MKKNEKISKSLKEYYKKNPKEKIKQTYICEKCNKKFDGNIRKGRKIHCNKCKRKVVHKKDINEVNNLFEFSKRTISKILNRMQVSCSICGWDKASCDLHHIIPVSKGGTDEHTNLTCVCPNCHREIHAGIKAPMLNLKEHIGDTWKEYYAISNC